LIIYYKKVAKSMKESISIQLRENMSFDVEVNGHKMIIDSAMKFGGNNEGPMPKSLMLVALAGCTGMDVVSLIKKMRVDFDDFRVEVEGNVTEEHPKHFDHMHIKYIIKGKDIQEEKVKSAIVLSQDKYCGVSYSFKKAMEITWELVIE
jgi:putative redox protein